MGLGRLEKSGVLQNVNNDVPENLLRYLAPLYRSRDSTCIGSWFTLKESRWEKVGRNFWVEIASVQYVNKGSPRLTGQGKGI